MSVDEFVKIADSTTKLLEVLVWPAIIGFVLLRFGTDFREFFSSLTEFTLKGAGFEASAKRRQAEA